MVAGNCDSWWGEDLPSLITIPACGHRIMVTHGHRYSVPYLNRLAEKAREKKADIVIFGHTHCYFMKKEDGILFLNPGAIRGCRDTGRPSYCLMVLGDDGKIHVRKKEFR
jgi:putative phosphoesterase